MAFGSRLLTSDIRYRANLISVETRSRWLKATNSSPSDYRLPITDCVLPRQGTSAGKGLCYTDFVEARYEASGGE
jgi:hypothetical protein